MNYVPKTRFNKSEQTNQIKCYQCGEDGHIRPNCKKENINNNMIKCYQCGEDGQIRPNCKKGSVNNNVLKREVNSITAERNRIKVKTNDVDTIALIDSGAEVSLIKLDMFEKLGIREHYKEDMVVAGIGGETDTLGFCRIKVTIQGYTYKIKVLLMIALPMLLTVIPRKIPR